MFRIILDWYVLLGIIAVSVLAGAALVRWYDTRKKS